MAPETVGTRDKLTRSLGLGNVYLLQFPYSGPIHNESRLFRTSLKSQERRRRRQCQNFQFSNNHFKVSNGGGHVARGAVLRAPRLSVVFILRSYN